VKEDEVSVRGMFRGRTEEAREKVSIQPRVIQTGDSLVRSIESYVSFKLVSLFLEIRENEREVFKKDNGESEGKRKSEGGSRVEVSDFELSI